MVVTALTRPKSNSIIFIVVFATIGFMVTEHFINANLIQYSTLPKTISFKVHDEAKNAKDSVVIFNLPVKSGFAIDTVAKQPAAPFIIGETNILYHQNPFFPVWAMLILVMITIASGSFPIFTDQIIQLKKSFNLSIKPVLQAIIYAVLIAVFLEVANASGKGYYNPPKIINDLDILFKNGSILPGIVLSTIILVLPVIAVMFLVGPSSDKLLELEINKDNAVKIANGLEMLNQVLRNALSVLSVIVVFTVLTSGTLKEAIKATVHIEGYDIFPTEISYAYGIFFSLFLCVIYIPVYFYLKQQYSYFKNSLAGINDLGDTKEKVLASLDFKSSAMDNLKTALTVLAPLITSFLPENLHFFK